VVSGALARYTPDGIRKLNFFTLGIKRLISYVWK
jgi:hypothetical protein